jgi:hypothetical protein
MIQRSLEELLIYRSHDGSLIDRNQDELLINRNLDGSLIDRNHEMIDDTIDDHVTESRNL